MLSRKAQGNVGREQKSGIDGSSQSIGKRSDEWYVDDNIEVVTAYGGRRLGEMQKFPISKDSEEVGNM